MAIRDYIIREDIYLFGDRKNINQKILTGTVGETSPNIYVLIRSCTQEVVNCMVRGGYSLDEILLLSSQSNQPNYDIGADLRYIPLVKLICDMVILKIYEGQYAASDQLNMYRVMRADNKRYLAEIQLGITSCLPSQWRQSNLSSITTSQRPIAWPSRYSRRPDSASRVRPAFPRRSIETKMYTLSTIDISGFNTEEYRYEFFEHMDGEQWLVKRFTLNDLNGVTAYSNAEVNNQDYDDYVAVAAAIDVLTYLPLTNLLYFN